MDDKKRYPCSGGPFHLNGLWLCTRSTAVFSLRSTSGSWHGRYIADSKNQFLMWEPA